MLRALFGIALANMAMLLWLFAMWLEERRRQRIRRVHQLTNQSITNIWENRTQWKFNEKTGMWHSRPTCTGEIPSYPTISEINKMANSRVFFSPQERNDIEARIKSRQKADPIGREKISDC